MPVGGASLLRPQICASGGMIRSHDRSTGAAPTASLCGAGGQSQMCLGDNASAPRMQYGRRPVAAPGPGNGKHWAL